MLPLGSGPPPAALRAAFPPESPLTALCVTSLLHTRHSFLFKAKEGLKCRKMPNKHENYHFVIKTGYGRMAGPFAHKERRALLLSLFRAPTQLRSRPAENFT